MNQEPHLLYLDLMKKVLSFSLWPEPPRPVSGFGVSRFPLLKPLASAFAAFLAKHKIQIGVIPGYSERQRIDGQAWPGYAHTMIGLKRLDNLQHCIESVLREDVEGDLIETGVWRGGACIFMRAVLAVYGIEDRKIFVADSFEGLPEPNEEKPPADKGIQDHPFPFLAVSQEEVEDNFKRYGLLDEQVVFLKGWFRDTLPQAPIDKPSILRLDGDMYESTMDALESLYPKLSKGGFCIVDDYALEGCQSAVNDYRTRNAIESEILTIDWSGCYWRK